MGRGRRGKFRYKTFHYRRASKLLNFFLELPFDLMYNIYNKDMECCRSGGIGRRDGLKILFDPFCKFLYFNIIHYSTYT